MIDTGLHLHWSERGVAHFKGYKFWVDAFTTADNDTTRYDWCYWRDGDYIDTHRKPDDTAYTEARYARQACELWIARNIGSW